MNKSPKPSSVTTGRKAYKKSLVASFPNGFVQRNHEHPVSLIYGGFRSSAVGHITVFLLKAAALETVRRFSKRRFSYAWRGLQALHILCYPPFKWIQRWTPFKGLVKSMQILSRPLLVISIATAFSEQSECSDGISDCITDSHDSEIYSELSVPAKLNDSLSGTDPEILESENWLVRLNKELENEGISLPERINEDELRRFYSASDNDFSCFLTLIKKTIHWRESYTILSRDELEMWSNMVFWHGSDVKHRPCLIVRLGLACSTLASQDRPRFSQAIISQVDYGVLHLVDAEYPQITVLVDCEGLSPLRIPMKMIRSCSSLLQDHFPNRLGCLFVIRLPAVVRVIAQTFIQVFKPATRKKLKIEGEMYQKVLAEYLPTLPSIFGENCTCISCSKVGITRENAHSHATGTTRIIREDDIGDNNKSASPHPSNESDGHSNGYYDKLLRSTIISFLIFWASIALIAGIYVTSRSRFPL